LYWLGGVPVENEQKKMAGKEVRGLRDIVEAGTKRTHKEMAVGCQTNPMVATRQRLFETRWIHMPAALETSAQPVGSGR